MGKLITGPWKVPNLAELLKRETDRLIALVERYKEEKQIKGDK